MVRSPQQSNVVLMQRVRIEIIFLRWRGQWSPRKNRQIRRLRKGLSMFRCDWLSSNFWRARIYRWRLLWEVGHVIVCRIRWTRRLHRPCRQYWLPSAAILADRRQQLRSVRIHRRRSLWRLLVVLVAVDMNIVQRALNILCRDDFLPRFYRSQKDVSTPRNSRNVQDQRQPWIVRRRIWMRWGICCNIGNVR